MLDLKRVLASAPRKRQPEEPTPLLTPWGEALDPENVLQEHPRPQFARENVRMLNGWWDYAFVSAPDAATAWRTEPQPAAFDGRILVPFSPEALLSGVNRQLRPDELLWYRLVFHHEPAGGPAEHVLLHFDGVDYACACYCNGVPLGHHQGAYLPFSFDITPALHAGENEISLCVYDPSDTGTQLRGKQKLEAGGIWYTAQSGIWQTVWLEEVPQSHVESIRLHADPESETLRIAARLSAPGETLGVTVLDRQGACVASACTDAPRNADAAAELAIAVPQPHLWSPESPYLYHLEIRYGADTVRSYCAFRTLSLQRDETGAQRFCLNGRPLFLRGVLDQGYWSDGLLTAPADEALAFDIQAMKDAGFNLLRKHIKVESARWYYHCDRLGMLVWQDMVTGGGSYSTWHTSYKPTLFRASWGRYADSTPAHRAALSAGSAAYRKEWEATCRATVERLGNHPCIVTWVLFNEAWGQFDARRLTEEVRQLDSTRPIDAVSGWYDQNCGDYLSVHNYFRPLEVYPDAARPTEDARAFVVSEFGGIVYHVKGHSMLGQSYGYEVFEDAERWNQALAKSLAAADALQAHGLAGYVYTQLSDVEEETNGLLTYDRRVNKLSCGERPSVPWPA